MHSHSLTRAVAQSGADVPAAAASARPQLAPAEQALEGVAVAEPPPPAPVEQAAEAVAVAE